MAEQGIPNPIDLIKEYNQALKDQIAGKPDKNAPKPKPPASYISPELQAKGAQEIAAINLKQKIVNDMGLPKLRLPPLADQASLDPAAVTFRMLQTDQAKALHFQQFHQWTNTAMKYGIPAPELIAAAIATRTPANVHAIGYLAKAIGRAARETGPGWTLSGWLWQAYPQADPVLPVYKAANAANYTPVYKR